MDAKQLSPHCDSAEHRPQLCPPRHKGLLVLCFLLSAAFATPVLASPQSWLPPSADRAIANRIGGPQSGVNGDSFLLSLEFSAGSNPLPLAAPSSDAASEADAPALVPLTPPLWAGMAILGILAYARHKDRRRAKPFTQLA